MSKVQACGVVLLLFFVGILSAAEPPVAQSTPLPIVLGLSRLPAADLVLLRDGTRQTGLVSHAALRLHTPHGELILPLPSLAGLDLTDDRSGLCAVITTYGDRLSGFLAEKKFELAAPEGTPANPVRRDLALKLVFQLRPETAAPESTDCLVRLRNGDFFRGRLLSGGTFTRESGVPIPWDAGSIRSVDFLEAVTTTARVVLQNGDVITARPAEADLLFHLASGLPLSVYAGRIDQLEWSPTNTLPADLLGRIGAPASGPQRSLADSAPPDSGVVPLPGMIWIPPGEFNMGSRPDERDRDLDEGPMTRVVFATGFFMGRHEVTQRDYAALMGQNPSQYQYEGETLHPVERVSWHDAVDYCRRLTDRERRTGSLPTRFVYRLPTEAEWEYACRAGTDTRFSFGDDEGYGLAREYVWFSRNSDSTTHPIGTKKPNPWGLHDIHGNVLEWCFDGWRGKLAGGTVTNSASAPDGSLRAVRGGSWLYDARYARSANRDSYGAQVRCSDLGFRVVLAAIGAD